MPKYPAWDDYGDPQCEQHGYTEPCHRCEDADPFGEFPMSPEPPPITAARREQLVKHLIEIRDLAKVYDGRTLAISEAIRLIEREPQLLAWADELEAAGGVGVFLAKELRNRLGRV